MDSQSRHQQSERDVPSAGASAGPSCTAGLGGSCERHARAAGRHRRDGRRAEALRLFFVEAWPVRLIARELGLSAGCVLRAINRGARRGGGARTTFREVAP